MECTREFDEVTTYSLSTGEAVESTSTPRTETVSLDLCRAEGLFSIEEDNVMFTFVTFANGFSECTKSFDELLKDGTSNEVASTAKTETVDFDQCCTASGGTNVELLEACRT